MWPKTVFENRVQSMPSPLFTSSASQRNIKNAAGANLARGLQSLTKCWNTSRPRSSIQCWSCREWVQRLNIELGSGVFQLLLSVIAIIDKSVGTPRFPAPQFNVEVVANESNDSTLNWGAGCSNYFCRWLQSLTKVLEHLASPLPNSMLKLSRISPTTQHWIGERGVPTTSISDCRVNTERFKNCLSTH